MVRLKLAYQIPEFLPMWGKKARVYYHGIPPFCVSCYDLGHVKNACKSETISWRDYIHRMVDAGISKDLFGSWLSCNLSVTQSSEHRQPSFSKTSNKSLNNSNDSITPQQLLDFFKKFQASTPNNVSTPTSNKSNSGSKASSSKSKPSSNSKSTSGKKPESTKQDSQNQNRNRGRGRGRGRGKSTEKSEPEPKRGRGR